MNMSPSLCQHLIHSAPARRHRQPTSASNSRPYHKRSMWRCPRADVKMRLSIMSPPSTRRQQHGHCLVIFALLLTISSTCVILCDITSASANGTSLTLSSSKASPSSSAALSTSNAVPKRPNRDLTEIVPDEHGVHVDDKSSAGAELDSPPLQPANNEQPFGEFLYFVIPLPCVLHSDWFISHVHEADICDNLLAFFSCYVVALNFKQSCLL